MKRLSEFLPDGFTYTAHTGCLKTDANSLDSIEAGASNGAKIVEFDLNFTKDGKAVLSHDEPKGNEPSLEEAFKKVSQYPDLMANVDVKSTKNLTVVTPLAEKHGISDRIFYTGIFLKDVEAVKKDSPQVPYYLNVKVEKPENQTEEYLQKLVDEVKGCGAVGINFNKNNATKKLVEKFRDNGLLVSIWTVNTKRKMKKILSFSPDNITTKRPDKMNRLLNK